MSTKKTPKAKTKQPYEPKRFWGSRPLSRALENVTNYAFRKQGFAAKDVLVNWPAIVGPSMAAQACPEKLQFPPGKGSGGTLYVRVAGALALELQHLEPLVIERINGYYGFQAVSRLVLRQGPLPPPPPAPKAPPRALTKAEESELDQTIEAVGDSELREALRGLGRSLIASGENSPRGPKDPEND